MKQYRVLLAGFSDGGSVVGVPEVLSRAGATVDVFCGRKSWLRKNRYFDGWIPCDTDNINVYAEQLESYVRNTNYDWVILTDDLSLWVMNEKLDDPDLIQKILPVSSIEARKLLGSKVGLSQLCDAHAILTPGFRVCRNGQDLVQACRELSFPLLIKSDLGAAGNGIIRCEDPGCVRDACERLGFETVLLQEYVTGDIVAVEALYCDGFLLGYAGSIVESAWPGPFGVSCKRTYRDMTELEPLLGQIGSLGLHGFVNMTFIHDTNSGIHYLIEADMRPQAWVPLARFVGMDFSVAARNFLKGTPITLRPNLLPNKEIPAWNATRDIQRAVAQVDFPSLFAWMVNREGRWKFLFLRDPIRSWHLVRKSLGFVSRWFFC